MATRVISPLGGNWHSSSAWVGGFIPTSNDDVVADASSGSITSASSNPICKSIDLSGYTDNSHLFRTNNRPVNVMGSNANGYAINIPEKVLTSSVNTSFSVQGVGNPYVLIERAINSISFYASVRLMSPLYVDTILGVFAPNVTLTTNGYDLSVGNTSFGHSGFTLDLGSSTFTIYRVGINAPYLNYSNSSGHSIVSSNATLVLKLPDGGVSPLWYSNALVNPHFKKIVILETIGSSAAVGFHENTTVDRLEMEPGSRAVFYGGKTTTINEFVAPGTLAKPIYINSSAPGVVSTFNTSSPIISGSDYVINNDVRITGSGSYYLGSHSTKTANATGWILSNPNLNNTDGMMMGFVC